MVSFLRKSVPLKYVTLVAAVLYMGVYKSQLISVVNVFGVLGDASAVQSTAGGDVLAAASAPRYSSLPPFAYSLAWYAFAVHRRDDGGLGPRLLRPHLRVRRADAAHRRRRAEALPDRDTGRARAPRGLHQVRHPVRRDRLLLRDAARSRSTATSSRFGCSRSTRRRCSGSWSACCSSRASSSAISTAASSARSAPRSGSSRKPRRCCRSSAGPNAASARSARRPANGARSANGRSSRSECVRCDDCEILYDDKQRCPHWLLELKRKARAALAGNAA